MSQHERVPISQDVPVSIAAVQAAVDTIYGAGNQAISKLQPSGKGAVIVSGTTGTQAGPIRVDAIPNSELFQESLAALKLRFDAYDADGLQVIDRFPTDLGYILIVLQKTPTGSGTAHAVNIEEEGTPVPNGPFGILDFIGATITAADGGAGKATVTVTSPPVQIAIEDEGAPQGNADTIDVVGAGASVSVAAGVATLSVPGGASLPAGHLDGFIVANDNGFGLPSDPQASRVLHISPGKCRDDTDTADIVLTTNKTIDADAPPGVGSKDSAFIGFHEILDIYVIDGPAVAADVLAVTDALPPIMPAGYTVKRRIASWQWNFADNGNPLLAFFNAMSQEGRGRVRRFMHSVEIVNLATNLGGNFATNVFMIGYAPSTVLSPFFAGGGSALSDNPRVFLDVRAIPEPVGGLGDRQEIMRDSIFDSRRDWIIEHTTLNASVNIMSTRYVADGFGARFDALPSQLFGPFSQLTIDLIGWEATY